ncbi:MAG: glycosyltransferase 87 family protein [Patescibacteria group bacterium]|nr:glycosyltransferase 87 family protein [Patescibacteria group bacterium]
MPAILRHYQWPRRSVVGLGILLCLLFLLYAITTNIVTSAACGNIFRCAGVFNAGKGVLVLLFLGMTAVYCIVYLYLRTSSDEPQRRFRTILFFSICFTAILFLSLPFMTTDIYGYIFRAEIAVEHHVNPYNTTPEELGYGTIVPCERTPMVYGPLYTIISMFLYKIGGSAFIAQLTVYRLFNVALFALCGYLVFRIMLRVASRHAYAATALFLWNPFVLLEVVSNVHNDIIMLAFILLSALFILRRQYVLAGAMLAAGFAVKFITIFLFPVLLLMLLKDRMPSRQKAVKLGLVVLAAFAVIAVLYLPFHNFSANVGNLGRAYVANYKLTFFKSVINGVVQTIGDVFNSPPASKDTLLMLYLVVFGAAYAVVLFWPRIAERGVFIRRYFWIIALALSFVANMFNIWYTIWLFPLLLLAGNPRHFPIILILTLSGFAFYLDGNLLANTLFWVLVGMYYAAVLAAPRLRFGIQFSDGKSR